jgi:hypothetical protein
MKILTKMKKWYKNFFKTKCPNCKSIKLEQLDKVFLYTRSEPYYNHSKFDGLSERAIKERYSSPDDYLEYNFYDIKYKCKECGCVFNKKKKE